MAAPRVSIGLPVYNGEAYLAEAIESVLAQTFADLELVICDNCSTDGTQAICEEYVARDPRVRYHRSPENVGAAANFNRAFELARGEYVKWIAADDLMHPEFLERCVAVLERDLGVVMVGSQYVYINEFEGTRVEVSHDHDFTAESARDRFRKFVGTQAAEHPVWSLMRREAFERSERLRRFIGSDSYFVLDMVLLGKVAQVPEHLNLLRIHAEAFSAKLRRQDPSRDGLQGESESRWIDPRNRGGRSLPHWRLLREYFARVVRSPEPLSHRAAMVLHLVSLVGFRWNTVLLKELFFAAGLGRVYRLVRDTSKKARAR